jgi:hypothetical protein
LKICSPRFALPAAWADVVSTTRAMPRVSVFICTTDVILEILYPIPGASVRA